MAVLSPPFQRVETAAGAPISGGKLRIYDVNTTDLADAFSDEAMATPLSNPVVADSNGFLPMIFCAENTYDIAYLSAADVVLTGQSFNDWPTMAGASANSIERTLSGARLDIDGGTIGDGNTGVRIQAGSPSPDDTGGYLRLGGWNGTQLDGAVVDSAYVNFIEPKSIQENGQRLAQVIETEPTAFSGTELLIALPEDPAGTRGYEITLYDMTCAATASPLALGFQLSYDNGATYKSGASDYAHQFLLLQGSTVALTSDDANTYARMSSSSRMKAGTTGRVEMKIVTPDSGTEPTIVDGIVMATYDTGDANLATCTFHCRGLGAFGRATHIRIYDTNTGTSIAGNYVLRILRGYGE